MASPTAPSWRNLALEKHNGILSAIPKEWRLASSILTKTPQNLLTPSFLHPLLTPLELEITTISLPTLLTRLATGHWTSLAVTTAFAHRAAIAHQLTACLSEFPLTQALATARALDAHLAQHNHPIGPLHGLPVSLKDSVDIRDVSTTLGFVAWTARPPREHDAALAAILREQGAVLFAKTAVPQASWATETFGNVISPAAEEEEGTAAAAAGRGRRSGDVPSPLNTALSAGGSSGGEAALVAFRGSPLGFGTDVGGSIRWPASAVGAYGLRPSKGRLPYAGIASVVGGLEAVTDVGFAVGPMSAGEVGDLGVAVRAVLGGRPWERDPLAVEMPWRGEVYRHVKEEQGKLVFGVLGEDGLVDLHPNVRRAVAVVTEVLRKAGHEVIPFQPPGDPATVDEFWNQAAYANLSHAHAQFAASGEPVDPRMPRAFDASKKNQPPLSTAEVQGLNVRIRKYRAAYLAYWMGTATHAGNSTGRPVDAVISPVAVVAAARRGRMRWAGYTYAVVLNDHTAAVLPVIKTDKNIDVRGPAPTREGSHAKINKAVYDDYDPEIYHGQPVNVQIIGRRFQEEKVLAITEYVDGLIKGQHDSGHKL